MGHDLLKISWCCALYLA